MNRNRQHLRGTYKPKEEINISDMLQNEADNTVQFKRRNSLHREREKRMKYSHTTHMKPFSSTDGLVASKFTNSMTIEKSTD